MMKKFLWKCLRFLALFLVASFGFNSFYTEILLRNSILNRTQSQFERYNQPIGYLFLGDSHAKFAVNPDLVESSFNFSSQGESYLQTFYKLQRILREKPIASIVLPLDLHSFSSFRTYRIEDEAYWSRYINYFTLAKETGQPLIFYRRMKNSFLAYVNNKERFLRGLGSLIKEDQAPLISGYMPYEKDFSSSSEQDNITAQKIDWHFKDRECLDPTLLTYFEKILQLCQEHDTQIILIQYPVTKKYYTFASAACAPGSVDAAVEEVLSSYPGVGPVLNYRKLFFEHDAYFGDSDHLNTHGAEKFSTMLQELFRNSERTP